MSPSPEVVSRSPGSMPRRALLGRGAALTAGALLVPPWLAGCAAEAAPHQARDDHGDRDDIAVLTAAIAAEQDLVATYEAARAANPALAGRLDPVMARHREHLKVLRRHHVPGSGHRANEGGGIPSPSAAPVPGGARVLGALRRIEDRAAAARTADAARARPGLAQLLASIGACEAGHAMTAEGEPPAVRSRSADQALQTVLAAEHAAVYGYGVLGARLSGAPRRTAMGMWDGHRARRDELESILSVRPVPAAAAYRLPVAVTSPRSAARLAVRLEEDLTAAYVGLAGASAADLRAFAADGARRAAARAARWRSMAGAAPPAGAFPGLPSSALTPRPRPGE